VPSQNIPDRLIRELMAEISESANDAIVTPLLFSWAIRTTRASISGATRGRLG
jgi:hypothetical protein